MKSFKNIVKRSPQTKGGSSAYNNQALSSQRSKNNSQNLLKKYNQTNMDFQKMTSRNKYRIVTEPMDDNMQQVTKSYSKLVRSKQREVKFDSQHTSIKARQKTFSNQKRPDNDTTTCLFCRGYQNELKVMNDEIRHMMNEKERWKKGELLLQDFEKQMEKRADINHPSHILATVQFVKRNILDLMADIEALTDIQFPKILSYNIFNTLGNYQPLEQEEEIKALLRQLREQSQGKTTAWDYDLDQHNEYIRVVMRNLKSHLAHYIRQNIELRTKLSLSKKEGSSYHADVRSTVMEILKGLAK